ncbi:TetR/AcrR family transcriptional regulator [Bdellovibrio bacteriovorus]|uniref:TetR/AcrR family transcriptional regulator n=1 Tax=Bdellovibrio reynosensis TaxID=2835041 RepID=A0ABY4CAD5_9BACT|nr:TetR/AcrR family transcriptional regulator [Bdellovibrio reynosensis]UOF01875.1 TetR/AcrR family transcriptional regulator [Bdellovibrio reynosensis]
MGAPSMSHTNPEKRYMLKIPVQKRSKETVASIVESCARLLVQEPYHAITTDKIAEMAGVSIGSLYQFFANKEAIVAAVIDDLLQKDLVYIEDHLSKLQSTDLDSKIHAFIDIGFTRFHDNRPLRTALQGVQGMLDYWDTRRVFFEHYQKAVLAHMPQIPGRDREMMALFIVSSFNNILQLALLGPQSPEREEAIKKEVFILIRRYLNP